MKDWKKVVLGSAVAVCLISTIIGIFSLVGVVQMAFLKIRVSGAGVFVGDVFQRDIQTISTCALIICAACVAVLVLCGVFLFWRDNAKPRMKKAATVLIIVIAAIAVASIIASFCMSERFSPFNMYYPDDVDYNDFVFYQSYLSAALTAFVPLLIGAVLLICCRFCKGKKHEEKPNVNAEEEVEEKVE